MNTSYFKRLATALLLASSLGTMSTHAAAPETSDSAGDAGPRLGHMESLRAFRDVAGRDIGSTTLQLELGPQYKLGNKLTLGGEWEPRQAAFVPARSALEAYSFDLRVSF